MDWQDSPRFSIIEEPNYTEEFAKLIRDPLLRDDIQLTFEREVVRNPYEFEEIPGTGLRAVTIPHIPLLTIVFSIDETESVIRLLAISPIP